jgi:hypothetical protein
MEKGKIKENEREERLYPINEDKFREAALPLIEAGYRGKGRPPKVSPYMAVCGILYILKKHWQKTCLITSKMICFPVIEYFLGETTGLQQYPP